ncbi:MAG: hypothetical protein ACOCV8_03855 [Spirochaetota bacterium]
MKKNIILFTFICVLLSVNVVYSQDNPYKLKTGNDLYTLYKSYKKVKDGNNTQQNRGKGLIYMSYIRGVWNSFFFFGSIKEKNKSNEQVFDSYGQFLENNPEIRDESSIYLFFKWLDEVGWLKE